MKLKKFFYCLFILCVNLTFAGNSHKINDKHKEQASHWLSNQKSFGFQENKGQVSDGKGNPVDFALFKVEAPNLTIWITTTGLTYQFYKLSEQHEERKPGGLIDKEKIDKEWQRVDMVLKSATIKKTNIVTEKNNTQGEINYYLAHCPQGVLNVQTYSKIIIKEVYPGIDWVLYTTINDSNSVASGIKYDFWVHPNADPKQIKLIYEGSGKLTATENQLHFENKLGALTEGKLFCYQNSVANSINSKYRINKNKSPLYMGAGNFPIENNVKQHTNHSRKNLFSYEVSFELGTYNPDLPLIIDPQLVWATFYGSPGGMFSGADGPMSIDCDINDNVYITGYTTAFATDFPTQTLLGAYNQSANAGGAGTVNIDAFILRFTNTGVLTWATYYGGTGSDGAYYITTDLMGNVYVTGETSGGSFPTFNRAGAYNQTTYGGGNTDAFILRFTSAGTLTWATYYGGTSAERPYSIAVDPAENILITGNVNAGSFPTFPWAGAYNQNTYGGGTFDAFILRFTSAGVLTWATFYGGSGLDRGNSIETDFAGNIYVTGDTDGNFPTLAWTGYNQPVFGGGLDAFIVRFTNTGARTWATYYGGAGTADYGNTIKTDSQGNIYVLGITFGNLPTQTWVGAYNQPVFGGGTVDAYLLRFTSTGVLTWATYYGGNGREDIYVGHDNIEIDKCDNVYISFEANSAATPTFGENTCGQYYDSSFNGGLGDVVIVEFNSFGSLIWATYFGGTGYDFREALALDSNGGLFVTGEWSDWGGVNPINNATYSITNPGGGAYFDNTFNGGSDDAYIAKFIGTKAAFTQSQSDSTVCNPCNGDATINITCGQPPYSYVWSNGNSTLNSSIASNTITNLCPGTYTVTVTSNCLQTQTAAFTITGTTCNTCTLAGQFTKGTATCTNCGCKEWVLVNAANGTPPYTYLWPDGYDKRYKNKLCPGNYTVKVTDKNGCSVDVNIIAP